MICLLRVRFLVSIVIFPFVQRVGGGVDALGDQARDAGLKYSVFERNIKASHKVEGIKSLY